MNKETVNTINKNLRILGRNKSPINIIMLLIKFAISSNMFIYIPFMDVICW